MTEALPSFSVIIPTFDRPAQLITCLQALARLDYPRDRFEVLVVDDGSHNPPREAVAEFHGSLGVRLIAHVNTGPAGARNLGATQAVGEFLAFTDDDCEPDAGWLKALALHLSSTPHRIIGGRTLNSLPHNPYSETSQAIIDVVYEHFNANPVDARFFASNNLAISAEHFRELKGFDQAFVTSEDRDLCARGLAHGLKLSYVPEAIIHHAHRLTLRSLWRQHFGYGRGALRFHRSRQARGDGQFKPDYLFYFKLLRSCISRGPASGAAQRTALLLWSQLANAVGFFYEGTRVGKAERGPQG